MPKKTIKKVKIPEIQGLANKWRPGGELRDLIQSFKNYLEGCREQDANCNLASCEYYVSQIINICNNRGRY